MAKSLSTYEKKMKNAQFKKAYEKSYPDLLFSEFMIAMMEDDEKSIRKLAKEAHLSPSVIQDIRVGKQQDMKVSNFIRIIHALGYEIILKKGRKRFTLYDSNKQISVVASHASIRDF